MQTLNTLLLLIRVSRPRFWLYLAGPFFVGISWTEQSIIWFFTDWRAWVLLLFFLVPANLILYGVNDLSDGDTDQRNQKKGTQEHLLQSSERTKIIFGVLVSIALFSLTTIVVAEKQTSLFWMLTWLFLSTSYSAPPLRFKRQPFVDAYSNILYIIPGLLSFTFFSDVESVSQMVIGVGLLWCAGMHTYSAIPDIASDTQAKLKTTAVVLGKTAASYFVFFNWLGATVLALLVHPLLVVSLAVYPVLMLLIMTRKLNLEEWYWRFPAINGALGFGLFVAGAVIRLMN